MENPERQGPQEGQDEGKPGQDRGPSHAEDQQPQGPPPESSPGEQGVTSPKQ